MRVYLSLIIALFLSMSCYALTPDDDEQEVRVVGDKNYTNANLVYDGIDVSNYQKDINWEATASDPNIKYVYIKATEGATHKQHRYRRNLENARRHGVKVGSYHFMRTSTSIQSQFENFISVVKREEQDLVPLLDVETREGWTIKQLQDSVMKFAQLLEEHFGCKPMIYTSSSYFNNYLGAGFANYPLFIARYAKSEPQLYFGAKWILWQFSDRGRIDGIDAMVDLSRFNRGCSLKDIAYRTVKPSNRRRNNGEVPRPKVRHEEKPVVPLPNKQRREIDDIYYKDKSDVQKRGEENARKRQKMEEKRLEEERKAQEKLRKEEEKKRKEIEKRQKEIEKKRAEEQKKRDEEERRRIEQEQKRQKEEAKQRARQQAQERMKSEKDRKAQSEKENAAQQERDRRNALEKAKQERLANEQKNNPNTTTVNTGKKPKYVPKGNNQSSADNDAVHYNKKKKSSSNN